MGRFELIKNINDPTFDKRLEEIIKPNSLTIDESYSLVSILNLIRNRLNGVGAIIEMGYIDADYQSQYAFWYSKSFKQFTNLCHRIHFFRRSVTLEEVAGGGISPEDYLGFTVLTPLTTGRVGRTVVRPWNDNLTISSSHFTPSILSAQSSAHLFGARLLVDGFPYTSQDSMVMVCAQSAIWMAIHYLHNRYSIYGTKRHYPDDITSAATRYLLWGGRILPSGGLTQQHMVNALSNLDYQPILDTPNMGSYAWEVENWLTKYLDSEIPVLLTLDVPSHAIVAVGTIHGTSVSTSIKNGRARIVDLHHWVRGFIVNDDNLGPYKIMPLNDADFPVIQASHRDLLPHNNTWKSIKQVDGIIIPLPREVSIQARHIDLLVQEILAPDKNIILRQLIPDVEKASATLKYFGGILYGQVTNDRIVTRACLIRSMEFLQKIKAAYPADVCEYYSQQQYPLYIWVIELTKESEVKSASPGSRKIIGEIIIDSTANRYDPCWLSVHISNKIVCRNPNTEDIETTDLDSSEPYRSYKLV